MKRLAPSAMLLMFLVAACATDRDANTLSESGRSVRERRTRVDRADDNADLDYADLNAGRDG